MNVPDDNSQVSRTHRLERLLDQKALAVVRTDDAASLPPITEALLAGGIAAIEVTMTVPGALGAIEEVCSIVGDDGIVGVGSVLTAEDAVEAIEAGAEFVVSPIFKRSIVDTAHQHAVPALPGALTPTEIQTAHEAGADAVKVFPASTMGKSYFGSVKAPLPHLRLCAMGGVSLSDAGDWLRSGASMVGVGSALLDGADPERNDYSQIAENARNLLQSLDAASEASPE